VMGGVSGRRKVLRSKVWIQDRDERKEEIRAKKEAKKIVEKKQMKAIVMRREKTEEEVKENRSDERRSFQIL